MNPDVLTVRPETPLKEVAHRLVERGISGMPVCDENGRVLGVVSEADILYKERGEARKGAGLLALLLEPHDDADRKIGARTAGEAMTSPAVTIEPNRRLAEAARVMLERGINRLPVVRDGKLVGIVTRADLVRAFERPDYEIAREIREDVVLRTLWIPDAVDVRVERGEVTLRGKLDTSTEVELVERLAERVPGVVAVHSELTWRDDLRKRRNGARTQPRDQVR
jgi:CBS domain-containing protein